MEGEIWEDTIIYSKSTKGRDCQCNTIILVDVGCMSMTDMTDVTTKAVAMRVTHMYLQMTNSNTSGFLRGGSCQGCISPRPKGLYVVVEGG